MKSKKPIKKYATGGTNEGKPVIKGVTNAAKKIVRKSIPKPLGSDELSSMPRPLFIIDNISKPMQTTIPKQKKGGVVGKSKKK